MVRLKRYGRTTIALLAIVISCAPLINDHERPADLLHPGMKNILSAGKSFYQGWNDSLASADEKPGMQSSFTYDYWIDTTEVTRKQYYDMAERNPVPDSVQYGVGDRCPVCFVTWFDAVLYCNARSKADGLDTVYSYLSKYTKPDGSVYDLTGLQCKFTRGGYRLPTEAEWEFAARGASSALPFTSSSDLLYALSVAWFGANSSGAPQPVAAKDPNPLGLYDLAGNVCEWTNDWKRAYSGKGVTDFLGAFQPDNSYKKVIKGGAYNSGLSYLRPSYRLAAAVPSSSGYVGFRCVRGTVMNGHYDTLQTPFYFAPDSLGIYNVVDDLETQTDFAIKMHFFWKWHNDLNLIFMGELEAEGGVAPSAFKHYTALNMGVWGCGIEGISTIMSNYLLVHAPKLKLIGIEIPFYFEYYVASFDNTMGMSKGYRYDKDHNFWKDGLPAGFDQAMAEQPFPSLSDMWMDTLGERVSPCASWGDTIPDTNFARIWTINDSSYRAQFAVLIGMIQEASAHNIHLLAINFPESPYYKDTRYYTRFGPDWETGRAVLAQLKALEAVYPYFHVYDANQDGNHDYTSDEANSWDRLCPTGAIKLTGRLETLIDSILKQ